MVSKKSLKGIEIYLKGKEELILDLENEVNSMPGDGSNDIANSFIKSLKTDVEFLNELK